MKRNANRVLCLVISLILFSCFSIYSTVSAENVSVEELAGNWSASYYKIEDLSFDISYSDMPCSLRLLADGSYYYADKETDEHGSWILNKKTIVFTPKDAEVWYATLLDGEIVYIENGHEIVFTKEGHESSMLPSPVIAENIDDLYGEWNVSRYFLNGYLIPADKLADYGLHLSGSLTISRNSAVLSLLIEEEQGTGNYDVSLTDGALLLANGSNNNPVTLDLCDTGELRLVIDDPFSILYFSKVTDTEEPITFDR